MAIYFLLGQLTPDGQARLSADPAAAHPQPGDDNVPGASILGMHTVLGHYDQLVMVEADDNAAVARLSAHLGARTGMRYETLSGVNLTTADIPALLPGNPEPEPAATAR